MAKAPATTPRVFGTGFRTLEGGVDGGTDASLIAANQISTACNLTMRGSLIKTRSPFIRRLLTFDSAMTESRFTGKFQKAMFYAAETGNSGFVLAVGGMLFRIQVGMDYMVTEITPKLVIVTTADFAVPTIGQNVTISVTSETPLTVGLTITIDSGEYLVVTQLLDQVVAQYLGGAAHGTAPNGSGVLDIDDNPIYEYETHSASLDFVFPFQAENYAIICRGQNTTVIYDGASSRTAGINELPPSLFGIYAWGRIWLTLNDRRTFIAGDIVYGPSGTPQNGFRDAILKVTENTFLNEGGLFGVPNNAGPITSMFALATQDTSLGIGPILIGTTNSVISCNAPVDRTTWKNLTYPIQTISLLDYGPQGPWNCASVNGDEWYRSLDGIRSFLVARRDIDMPGNTPNSREVSNILAGDSEDLLFHGSTLNFDNRVLQTVAPYFTPTGIAHRGMVALNNDLVSNLRVKVPPAWEGAYSGINVLQLLKGLINGKERGFAFVLNGTSIELWELLKEKQGVYDQYPTEDGSGNVSITSTAIESFFETRRDDAGNDSQLKKLYTAEFFIDNIIDEVSIKVRYRPDEYPDWTDWATLDFCATVSQCAPPFSPQFNCTMWKTKKGTYAARVLILTPPEMENVLVGGYLSTGYAFQFRFECSGSFRIRKFMPHFTISDDSVEGIPHDVENCTSFSACDPDFFGYDSKGV